MAETIKRKAAGQGLGALDRLMAGFLAAAVGFVLLAIPADILPIEGIARLALAASLAFAAFVLVTSLLEALGKPRKRARKPAERANEPPRLRRADAHPDAPSRSPILAGRELGVPLDEVAVDQRPAADLAEVENVDFAAEWDRPLPGFIDGDPLTAEPEPAEWEPIDEAPEPAAYGFSPGQQPAGQDIPFWVPEQEAVVDPEPVDVPPIVAEAAAEQPEPPMAVPFRTLRASRPADPVRSSPDHRSPAEQSGGIGEMVERFETGLVRRPQPTRVQGPDAELDQRLRSALGDLKRMSGRR